MRKVTTCLVAILLANIIPVAALAQNVAISGTVRNSITQEEVPAVSVTIKGDWNRHFYR